MVKAMRDLAATEMPVVLAADTLEHLIALAEVAPAFVVSDDEAAALQLVRECATSHLAAAPTRAKRPPKPDLKIPVPTPFVL